MSVSNATAAVVLDALDPRRGATAAELALATRLGRSTVDKALAALCGDGRAHRRSPEPASNGRRTAARWYANTPDASRAVEETTETTERPDGAPAPTAAAAGVREAPPRRPETSAPLNAAATPEATTPEAETAQAETAEAETAVDVGGAAVAAGGGGCSQRLGKGALRALVLERLHAEPDREHSPTSIAAALDRSSGAVANALVKLVIGGLATQTRERPRRYQAIEGTRAASG